ncbi:MAG: hypothetical protein WD077_10310 [Bacteroidia bacterium]
MLINILRLMLFAGLIFTSIPSAFSQTYNSPFTLYGLGETHQNHIARFQGMGGVNYGYRNGSSFTIANPASYSALKYTAFETGLRSRWAQVSLNENKFATADASFGYLALAFPVSRKIPWSVALGLTPFSKKGYRLRYQFTEPFQKEEIFSGSGNYSKFFLGTSVEVIKNLSIGVNANYFFGNQTDTHTVAFQQDLDFYNLTRLSRTSIGDFVVDAGIQYTLPLKDGKQVVIGAIANLPTNLKTQKETVAFTYDTVRHQETLKYNTLLPFGGGLGITYSNKELLSLGMDFYYRSWSDYKQEGQVYDTLQDRFEISLGGSFQFSETGQATSDQPYWKRIPYRFGIKYVKPFIDVEGSEYHETAVSLGAGFRLKNQKGLPSQMLDISLEAGQISNFESDALKERYLLLHVGFSLNQSWFGQRKID